MEHFIPPAEAARSGLASRRLAAFWPPRDSSDDAARDLWPKKPVGDAGPATRPNADPDHFIWAAADDVPTDDWKTMLRWLARHPGRRILSANSQVILYTAYREVTAFDRSTWRAYRLRW